MKASIKITQASHRESHEVKPRSHANQFRSAIILTFWLFSCLILLPSFYPFFLLLLCWGVYRHRYRCRCHRICPARSCWLWRNQARQEAQEKEDDDDDDKKKKKNRGKKDEEKQKKEEEMMIKRRKRAGGRRMRRSRRRRRRRRRRQRTEGHKSNKTDTAKMSTKKT